MKTPEELAELKFPYDRFIENWVIDGVREAYAWGLKDAPQLNRQALETVRQRCAKKAFKSLGSNPHLGEVAKHINNLIKSVNIDDLIPSGGSDGWVSVEDGLPKVGQLVLAYDSRPTSPEHHIVFVDGINKFWYSHWQPLPTPPQTVKK